MSPVQKCIMETSRARQIIEINPTTESVMVPGKTITTGMEMYLEIVWEAIKETFPQRTIDLRGVQVQVPSRKDELMIFLKDDLVYCASILKNVLKELQRACPSSKPSQCPNQWKQVCPILKWAPINKPQSFLIDPAVQ